MRYKITISELRESTNEYRRDDEYDIFEVKVEGDETIVPAVHRTILEYMEQRFVNGIKVGRNEVVDL